MRRARIPAGLRSALLAALGPLAWPGVAAAQQPAPASGSAGAVFLLQQACSGGGTSSGPLYALASQVGCSPGGATGSPLYAVVTGAALASADFAPATPVVFAVDPPEGDRLGGQAARVIGFGFQSAPPVAVLFAGAPAALQGAPSNTEAFVLTPPGVNAYGNPLGASDVALDGGSWQADLAAGYAYTPAVLQGVPAVKIGCPAVIRYSGPPGSLCMLAFGQPIPGFALPIPPFGGALELTSIVTPLSGLLLAPTGKRDFVFQVPPLPMYVGYHFLYQMISIASVEPLAGSFTNVLLITIEA